MIHPRQRRNEDENEVENMSPAGAKSTLSARRTVTHCESHFGRRGANIFSLIFLPFHASDCCVTVWRPIDRPEAAAASHLTRASDCLCLFARAASLRVGRQIKSSEGARENSKALVSAAMTTDARRRRQPSHTGLIRIRKQTLSVSASRRAARCFN